MRIISVTATCLGLLLLAFAAYSLMGMGPDSCPSLERLKSADARADALAAAQRGDRHLLMLGGFVGTVPGGEHGTLPTVLIEGTEDTTTEACFRLNADAEAYARRYNEAVLSLRD